MGTVEIMHVRRAISTQQASGMSSCRQGPGEESTQGAGRQHCRGTVSGASGGLLVSTGQHAQPLRQGVVCNRHAARRPAEAAGAGAGDALGSADREWCRMELRRCSSQQERQGLGEHHNSRRAVGNHLSGLGALKL